MARFITAFTNRLGNRSSNQDRCLVVSKSGQVLLAVADGMGGHERGDLAAQIAVESLEDCFLRQPTHIADPRAFLTTAIETAHLDVVDAGKAQQPQVVPRTTCVACLVDGRQASWAHVGDSRLYLLRDGRVWRRTRDHTPLEELLRTGTIDEDAMRSHPLRNSVSRCLGGSPRRPGISHDSTELQDSDILLLCSDGLWSALSEEQLTDFDTRSALDVAVDQLATLAESASYPHSDNISLVGLRWLATDEEPGTTTKKPAPPPARSDPLQEAIDEIHRAMLDYASEMKNN